MRKHILFLKFEFIFLFFIFLVFTQKKNLGDKQSHIYETKDKIDLISDRIWPKGNPSETYHYYNLPYCKKVHNDIGSIEENDNDYISIQSQQNLASDVSGGARFTLPYNLPFKVNMNEKILCSKYYNKMDLIKFQNAIKRKFRIMVYYDGLPITFPVGFYNSNTKKSYLFTHLKFFFKFNGKRVIGIRIIPDLNKKVEISQTKKHQKVMFSYSTSWQPVAVLFDNRLKYQQQRGFLTESNNNDDDELSLLQALPEEVAIQWFSIINSLILVIILSFVLVIIISRMLQKDVAKYTNYQKLKNQDELSYDQQERQKLEQQQQENADDEQYFEEDDDPKIKQFKPSYNNNNDISFQKIKEGLQNLISLDEDELLDEGGWKNIAKEIFQRPKYINLLSAILGNGVQLLTMSISVLILAVTGAFWLEYSYKGMNIAFIIVYILTSGISGFCSAAMYKKLGGKKWISNVILTVLLFAGPVFLVWSYINTLAIFYSSTVAFPFRTIVFIVGLYVLVAFPTQLIGAFTAKKFTSKLDVPIQPGKYPKKVLPIPWYKSSAIRFLIAGILPFSAIYIELYYVFISLWGHILYTPYPVLLVVFGILILVTSCITVATTYLQIHQEDHHWWWSSIVSGGFSSVFIFCYSFYYFYFETAMSSFFQIVFYFSFMSMFCYAFFLMMSTVAFFSSFMFLKYVYRQIKFD